MIQLALLSYIFIALFRDTPLVHICRPWSDGQMAINGHYGHLAIRPSANDISKWGIPEKSYKNLAQQSYLDHGDVLLADFIAKH